MSAKSLSPLINCPAGFSGAYTIPDGVISIDNEVFARCSALKSVTIPDSVTSIGDVAFDGCTALASVNVHPDNPNYASVDGTLFNKELTVLIECPVGFSGDYTVPDGVTSIDNAAFARCTALTSVIISSSVTSIGRSAFSKCYALTAINVHPDNMYYTSFDGVLFNKELTVLIKCPAGFSGACTVPNSVTAISNGAFFNCRSISAVTLSDGVSSIGESAFSGCSALTSAILPDRVTSIAEKAFAGCSALASVTIGNGVISIGNQAFCGCSALTSFTLPDGVTSIGDAAFSDCTSLAAATIGNGVISIGNYAFCGCSALTSVTIGNGVTSIGYQAFCGCSALTSASLPDSVTYIGYRAFYGCYALTSATIGNGVISIGNQAFCGCSALTSVTIPDSVTSIGDEAFSGCHALTCVIIGNSATSIGESAFCDCASLASVTIPDSVTRIGNAAFSDCTSLTNINVHPNNMNYASFDGVLFNKQLTFLIQCPCCSALTSFAIPDSVTSIGDFAFCNCTSLTSVTIGNGVTSIGESAFCNCSSLTSVIIPDSVTTIGKWAFSCCSALTNINVHPNNMNYASVDGVLVKIEVFELTDEDVVAIEIAKNVARRFLKNPQITPKQVIALGNALYALERLPLVTPGVATEFGIEYRAGTKEYSEMRYIDFRISESEFEISKGGSVYDKASGSDSFSDPGWLVGTGGKIDNECDLYELEGSIDEYLNLGAKLSISDESEIKYE